MTDNPLYEAGSAAMILSMAALRMVDGTPAAQALDTAHHAWREHVRTRGNTSLEFSDLRSLVERLTS
ncbi:hypothetical protein [Mycobacterium sp. 1164985.4]|uniref:hypothetical protein n=1 Tax=Mycobacterium sp. 1164985.4 TaxID=1834069 RepID=UPI0007FF9122|nr:hypothetical protein [Mycobacterium sp. 1164985.4]OBK82208.1 hypothetical protein A5650_23760 [Mycobacterium sp. 1164985.4]